MGRSMRGVFWHVVCLGWFRWETLVHGYIVQNAACQNNLACLLWAIEQFPPCCIETHPPGLQLTSALHNGTSALMRKYAVYCSDYVWQSSHGMKVPLNLYLFDSGVWEFNVSWVINWWELWGPRWAHNSQRTGTHPICLQSPSERFLWPKVQGWWAPGRVVELGLIGVFLLGVVDLASCTFAAAQSLAI